MMKKFCGNCLFFKYSNDDWGRCHRYAPRPAVGNDDEDGRPAFGTSNFMAVWPYTGERDFCGEWQLEEPEPEEDE